MIPIDNILDSERTICAVRWDGRIWRCIGRARRIDDESFIVDVFYTSLPRLEQEYGTHCLGFYVAAATMKKDASGEAAWICNQELNADELMSLPNVSDDVV